MEPKLAEGGEFPGSKQELEAATGPLSRLMSSVCTVRRNRNWLFGWNRLPDPRPALAHQGASRAAAEAEATWT